jgi:hypothetical protein
MALIRALPAVFFLALATLTGARLCRWLLPDLDGSRETCDKQHVGPWVIALPTAFPVRNAARDVGDIPHRIGASQHFIADDDR